MFLIKNKSRIAIPKSSFCTLDLRMRKECRKTNIGSHIMVGFTAKTNIENAKRSVVFLLPMAISFKIISEKIITGRSGLGDCENKNSTGKKHR
jgi:predicted RNA-binding protein with EMAP domain